MKKITLFFLCIFLFYACTKDCCFDGDPITESEALDILNQNESGDSLVLENITAALNCLNGNTITDMSILIKDASNSVVAEVFDNAGAFDFPVLEDGTYVLQFVNNNLPSYTQEQWDDIINRVEEIYLFVTPATNIEKLAYNVVGYENGITSFDRVIFEKLKDGSLDITEIEFPWRYVLTSELNISEVISDSISIIVNEGENVDLEITPIFIGDTIGQFCN